MRLSLEISLVEEYVIYSIIEVIFRRGGYFFRSACRVYFTLCLLHVAVWDYEGAHYGWKY